MKSRRLKSLALTASLAVGAAGLYAVSPHAAWQAHAEDAQQVQAEEVVVYKSPTCGCCGDWVKHLEQNGFQVKVHNVNNLNPIKKEAGLTPALASCHTAFVGGYTIEGHVPAQDIRRLLKEKPSARGLAVPGMPIGSPGMEVAGKPNDPYDVILFRDKGQTERFSHHE